MTLPPSAEQIKAMADRAEARSRGDGAATFVAAALSEGEINVEIEKLAALPVGVYESTRVAAAKKLHMRASILDTLVSAKRPKPEEEAGVEPLHPHWVVEPSEEPVDGDALLRDLIARMRRHIVYDDAMVTALWIAFSWVHDIAVHSPILLVHSAEPECGKTTLLSLLSYLTPRAVSSVDISKAALFRSIQMWGPSFVIDEFDDVLSGAASDESKAEMRSVINSGHTRGTGIIRCVTDEHKPELFPTFCPKAIGMIRRKPLPPATQSRCIAIPLRRRTKTENIEAFAFQDDAELADLRSRLCRWGRDNAEELRGMDVHMPDSFYNRRADNWRLLFAIADLCDEGDHARTAAIKLEEGSAEARRTVSTQVLSDCRTLFNEMFAGNQHVGSAELAAALAAHSDSPWSEWKNGKPITQAQLARLLKPFGIKPEVIRIQGGGTPRGYLRTLFEDAWERYL